MAGTITILTTSSQWKIQEISSRHQGDERADANGGYYLVLTMVKLRLCRANTRKQEGTRLYNTVKLREQQVKEPSYIEIQNRFKALINSEDASIEED